MDSVTAVSRIEGWTSRRIRVDRTRPDCWHSGQSALPSVIRHNTVKCLPVCVLADGGESELNQAEKKKTPAAKPNCGGEVGPG